MLFWQYYGEGENYMPIKKIPAVYIYMFTFSEPLPSNQAELFQWLPKEHMCVLVYLITVIHSMQAGYMDKAQKYTDKALMQIEKLKSKWLSYMVHNT